MVGVEELSSETLPVWLAPHTRTPIDGVITVPGSKSITNRAFILAALADGPSAIVGALRSRDTNLMLAALKSIGVGVRDQGSEIHIEPRPLRGGVPPPNRQPVPSPPCWPVTTTLLRSSPGPTPGRAGVALITPHR